MPDERSIPPGKGHDGGTASVMVAQGRTRLVLSGEIDVALSSELSEAVAEAEASRNPVEIDARHVTFMDSSGVALLARLAHRTPGPLAIIKPPDVVRFLLDITRLGDVVTILEDDPGFPDSSGPDGDDAA
ncbi:STAS domain-containing protein [uncultured Georgenia sp.]|uniref:STAS domain-containing protein n=1 Tax=uncultured Georgenia sp. TaxID=378209 RepID=UPI0026256610|nr:STAS domain-containing protein [uncultured Georgenia sp.]HLV03317.1 STAS domain-containing protein [Actinomycetaceae bacterium]